MDPTEDPVLRLQEQMIAVRQPKPCDPQDPSIWSFCVVATFLVGFIIYLASPEDPARREARGERERQEQIQLQLNRQNFYRENPEELARDFAKSVFDRQQQHDDRLNAERRRLGLD